MSEVAKKIDGRRSWTDAEKAQVMRMKPKEFAAAFGKPMNAIHQMRKRLRAEVPPPQTYRVEGPPDIPESVEAERSRRLLQRHRDITAAMLGDPLPGYSALDKYHRDLVSA